MDSRRAICVLSACYSPRLQGGSHGHSQTTLLSLRRQVEPDSPQMPNLTVPFRTGHTLAATRVQAVGAPCD